MDGERRPPARHVTGEDGIGGGGGVQSLGNRSREESWRPHSSDFVLWDRAQLVLVGFFGTVGWEGERKKHGR